MGITGYGLAVFGMMVMDGLLSWNGLRYWKCVVFWWNWMVDCWIGGWSRVEEWFCKRECDSIAIRRHQGIKALRHWGKGKRIRDRNVYCGNRFVIKITICRRDTRAIGTMLFDTDSYCIFMRILVSRLFCYSTVTLFARFLGLSTSWPRRTAAWYARSWRGTVVRSGCTASGRSGM